MALHLIIDGYNLIRQSPWLSRIEAGDLQAGREALLTRLAAYRRTRPQLKVTVVFDGWLAGERQEGRDLYQGIVVIFSRRGEKADEVIKRLLAQESKGTVVVSSDREIRDFADGRGATWVTAGQFESLYLYQAGGDADTTGPEPASSTGSAKKGPARRPSKRQRQRQQRLRKL
ncbi:MAG: NYN domain-containing protein [Thermodesulfobacteriota bacterium]